MSSSTISQSISLPTNTTPTSATPISPVLNSVPPPHWIPADPSFHVPPGNPGTPATMDSSPSSTLLRPIITTPPLPPNPAVQQHPYPPPYLTVPPPPGLWLQPLQINNMPRPPFLSSYPVPFPFPARGMPLPSVPLPNPQPPGVTPLGTGGGAPTSTVGLGMRAEFPPGVDNSKTVNDESTVSENLGTWTAHKTESGAVYYYNTLTGVSTYEKPTAFKGETDKVTSQPMPVSWEKLAGTEWALVTTNDGKNYYYNTKTKLSSWQIPAEVTELRKKQAFDPVEPSVSATNTNVVTDKGCTPISLNAPAVHNGGREAIALRVSGAPGPGSSSSALELIKKKLQEFGVPPTSSPVPTMSGQMAEELNGSRLVESTAKGQQSENSKDKIKDVNGDGNMSESSSDSDDVDSGLTKEECIIQFKEMLKERGVAPFSKWDKELPKILFDPRFKAIPNQNARRALFEHYVRTRAEEERKEKRAAQKVAIESFKHLLDEAKEDIDHNTNYQTFRKKWGSDPRFEALDRKEREVLLNERVGLLKKAAEEKALAIRAATISSFMSMLRDKGDITTSSRWSKVKDSLRDDPRYKSVKHEEREALFDRYIFELKTAEEEAARLANSKREEQEKLKEREREFRKRKEREEQEVERVRSKARRKEAVESYQALLVESIKDPQASWTESKPKLEKDSQGRAGSSYLDQADLEIFFREHVKTLYERCVQEFRALLAERITAEVGGQETEDGKTALTSWSTAKRHLKGDPRYTRIPRKERETLWHRYTEDIQRRLKLSIDQGEDKHSKAKARGSVDSHKYTSGSRRTQDRR